MFQGCSPFDVEQTYQDPLINNPSSSWLHTPPAQMPWSISNANQPSVMRFTGDPTNEAATVKDMGPTFINVSKPHSKRKSWDTEIEYNCPPVKQLITEEKMAENLNGLHISNSYVSHQIGSSQPMSILLPESKSVASVDSAAEPSTEPTSLISLDSDGKDRTVSLCEQLRKLISEASVIPSPLLNKVERPCNALVLWQPLGGSIIKKVQQPEKQKQYQEEESKPSTSGTNFPQRSSSHANTNIGWSDLMDNNNSSSTTDLNILPISSSPALLPSEVPLPDDDVMDLPDASIVDVPDDSMMDF